MATAAIGTAVSVGLSALSGALTPTKTIFNEQNIGKLEDISSRKTGAGWSLSKVYGRVQIKGCPIFWAPSRKEEVVTTTETQRSGGNKFGGGRQTTVTTTNTYKYFGTFAFAICDGQIDDIRQIKFNDTIWYNRDGELPGTVADRDYKLANYLTIHIGGGDQVVDPTIESIEGNENGDRNFKGLCYCVVNDFPLDEFGGELPSTIDVIVRREDNFKNRIDEVIYEVSRTVGLVAGVDVKCSGLLNSATRGAVDLRINGIFKQDGQTAADFINELVQRHFLVSYLDDTGAIVFELPENTTDSVSLNYDQLAAVDYGSEPGDPYSEIMPDVSELPSSVTLNYTNLNDDFNSDNETRYYPLASHYNPKSINSGLFLTPDDAKWWTWKYLEFSWLWARRFTVNLLPEDAVNLTESFRLSVPLIDGQSSRPFNIASIVYGANLIGEVEFYSYDANVFDAQVTVNRVNQVVWNGGIVQLTPNIETDVSVISGDGLTTYIEGVDYTVNPTTGELTILPGGDINNGDSITVYYGSQPDYTITVNNPDNELPDYGEPVITVVETNRIRSTDAPCIYVAIARDGDFGATTIYGRVNGGTYQGLATALLPTAKGTLSGTLPLASGLDVTNTATVVMSEGELDTLSQAQFDNQEIILLIGNEQIVARDVTLTAPNTYEIEYLQRGVNGTPPVAHSNGEAVYIAKGTTDALIPLGINQTLIGQEIDLKAVPNNVTLVDITTVTTHTIQGIYYKPYAPSDATATKDSAGNITINWVINDTGLDALIPQAFEVDIIDGVNIARTLTSDEGKVKYLASDQADDFGSTQSTITIAIYQLSNEVGRGYGYNIVLTPTLLDPAPDVLDFSPRSGQIGDAITIYGSAFTSATSATVNGVNLTSFVIVDDSTITGIIATGTTSGKVTVVNPSGTGTSLTDFVIVTAIVDWGQIGGNLDDQADLAIKLDGLQDQINEKEPIIEPGTATDYWGGEKEWLPLNKAAVGLGNVDNTADVDKPISNATQNALNAKFNNPSGTTSQYIRGDGSLATFPTTFSSAWGEITGTLSSQTDLQNALNAKFNNPSGTTSQYIRGDGSLATFPTSFGSAWGTITGTLSSQTDLQNALNAKFNTPSGTTLQYVRGDGSLATFPTSLSTTWGNITGTLSNQTDLQNALNSKFNTPTGTTDQYIRGNGTLATFPNIPTPPTTVKIPGVYAPLSTPANGTVYLFTATATTTINQLRKLQTSSGTCTVTIQINGVNVTGLTNLAVTSTPQNPTATGANVANVGQDVTLIIASVSSATKLQFTLDATLPLT